MLLDHPVVSALVPVVALIGVGFVAGRWGRVGSEVARGLSQLVFMVLVQALLFRTMATVQLARLELAPMALYYAVTVALFLLLLLAQGPSVRAAMLALAGVFSNMLMIGVPLMQLAYGQAALVHLFTLISLHALVVLTVATIVTELLLAREQAAEGGGGRPSMAVTVGRAIKSTVLHPVPLPIIVGLAYSLTGWGLHPVVERPLKLLGDAFGPMALLLVGLTLAHTPVGRHVKTALALSVIKTVAMPLLMWLAARAAGFEGMVLTVLVVAAGLPIGANVFLFSQRYRRGEEVVTAGMAVSTAVAVVTLSVVMSLMGTPS